MKFQIASDLHQEFAENRAYLELYPLLPKAPILILAGDIRVLNAEVKDYNFLKYVSDNWEQTYIVPGNHEYYKLGNVSEAFDLNIDLFKNVKYLNHQKIEINGCDVYFSTLWSKPSQDIELMISDYVSCMYDDEQFNVSHHRSLHKKAVEWLTKELKKPKVNPRLVVTHFVPCMAVDAFPKPFTDHGRIMKEYYTANLDDMIEEWNVDHWLYGHNHWNKDSEYKGTQFVSNMLGYVVTDSRESFKRDKVINIAI